MKTKYLKAIFVTLFACLLLFVTLNKHSKAGIQNYHSQIWGDKAGYYIYLPAIFKYNFDPNQFPDSIDIKTGGGFQLDRQNGKIYTKYTCGVALMQLPFYFTADVFCKLKGTEASGFSKVYHNAIDVAAVFYTLLGFFFLFKFLEGKVRQGAIYLTLLSVLLATNLFYYAVDETGMSHIYSFALFSCFLYILKRSDYLVKISLQKSLFFGLIAGLIVLVRPTNFIFLTAYLFLDIGSKKEIGLRMRGLLNKRVLIPSMIGFVLALSPQLIYWWKTYDSLIYYSYQNEVFYWLNPMILTFWFSPNNGLFLYGPFYLLLIPALMYYWKRQRGNARFVIILFILLSYLFSCWHDCTFGCSYGARNLVEYNVLFCLPLAFWYNKLFYSGLKLRLAATFFILFLSIFNLKLSYSYDGCFQGTNSWDWGAYCRLVEARTK